MALFGLPYEYRPYRCMTCGRKLKIGTNHTDVCFAYCPGCSWRGGIHPTGEIYHPSPQRAFEPDTSGDEFDKLLGMDLGEAADALLEAPPEMVREAGSAPATSTL